MKLGLVPGQMEDKWFIYWQDDALHFHRSWSGFCIYVARFTADGDSHRMFEADLNREPEQYGQTDDDHDAAMISYLIDVLLLEREADFPTDAADRGEAALAQWSQVGRAMLGEHPERHDVAESSGEAGLRMTHDSGTQIAAANRGEHEKESTMGLNIADVAATLNDLAPGHPIGQLQDIRKDLNGLEKRPTGKLFSGKTITPNWAAHYGGRTELQFNIGREESDAGEVLRHGVAFSFETSQALPTIDVLVPKVGLFNDYLRSNVGDFADMRMWHWDTSRGPDRRPGPVPEEFVTEGVFVFMGKCQPADSIDHELILTDFDRLLPLYRYVQSGGASEPIPLPPRTGFEFRAGCPPKAVAATATFAAKVLDIDLRHNLLSDKLVQQLIAQYGVENVSAEQPSGAGTRIDAVVRRRDQHWFYEIKTARSPRVCIREALGQLLEYGYWPRGQDPAVSRLVVVGEAPLGADGTEYLRRLTDGFNLPLEYMALPL